MLQDFSFYSQRDTLKDENITIQVCDIISNIIGMLYNYARHTFYNIL